ncbi:ricin B lectin domain-containing protein [Coprinopsis sp. MPI-PUGE-AT-0042]|nr:ricin B lectin domain-containing protein [Coprinopsis sp. MPI-PUGE-AT-0042]
MVQSGHRYKIVNVKGGTVVDLNTSNNKSIHAVPFHGGFNQLWDFHRLEDGNWIIQNAETGGFLAVANGKAGDNVDAIHRQDGAFSWNVFKDETDQSVWRIAAANSAFHLDLSNHGDSKPGTPVKVWGAWEGRNQCWRLEEGMLHSVYFKCCDFGKADGLFL